MTTSDSLFNPNPVTAMNTFTQLPVNEESATLNPISAELELRSNSIAQYWLSTQVKTVVDLWEEYKTGFPHQPRAPAGPSIEQLDKDFGAKWRTRDDCRKAYSRRRHIWETVVQATENLNISSDIIAQKMDQWRENQGYTLQRLNTALANSHKHDSQQSGLWGYKDVDLLSVV
jgi:Transcriptional activator of glycolytic enzymes